MYKFLFILLTCSIISCGSSKKMIKDMKTMSFGNYGGFAGSYTSYQLDKEGNVKMKTGYGKDYVDYEKIDKKDAEEYFKQYAELKLDTININDPGNLTYFVEMQKETEVVKHVWGGSRDNPTVLKSFYKAMMASMKERQQTK